MNQIPLELWNKMAPSLKTPWVKELAQSKDFNSFESQSEQLEKTWQQDGLDPLTAAAYPPYSVCHSVSPSASRT